MPLWQIAWQPKFLLTESRSMLWEPRGGSWEFESSVLAAGRFSDGLEPPLDQFKPVVTSNLATFGQP